MLVRTARACISRRRNDAGQVMAENPTGRLSAAPRHRGFRTADAMPASWALTTRHDPPAPGVIRLWRRCKATAPPPLEALKRWKTAHVERPVAVGGERRHLAGVRSQGIQSALIWTRRGGSVWPTPLAVNPLFGCGTHRGRARHRGRAPRPGTMLPPWEASTALPPWVSNPRPWSRRAQKGVGAASPASAVTPGGVRGWQEPPLINAILRINGGQKATHPALRSSTAARPSDGRTTARGQNIHPVLEFDPASLRVQSASPTALSANLLVWNEPRWECPLMASLRPLHRGALLRGM